MKYLLLAWIACSSVTAANAQDQRKTLNWLTEFFRRHNNYIPISDDVATNATSSKRVFHYRVEGTHDSLEIVVERISFRFATAEHDTVTTKFDVSWKDIRSWKRNPGEPHEFTLTIFNDRYIRMTLLRPYNGNARTLPDKNMVIRVNPGLEDDQPFRNNLEKLTQENRAARHQE